MTAFTICDIRQFTSKLFVRETFDRFLVREAVIVTFNTFTIDGSVRRGYYSPDEQEAEQIGAFSSWRVLRPFCFSLIKGKRLPESFSIVLRLPPDDTARLLAAYRLPQQDAGLFLNIRYENQRLRCITGVSLSSFSIDRTLEQEWDRRVEAFLRSEEIACTRD